MKDTHAHQPLATPDDNSLPMNTAARWTTGRVCDRVKSEAGGGYRSCPNLDLVFGRLVGNYVALVFLVDGSWQKKL